MMPSYVLGILAQGNCPALVRGGVFVSHENAFFAWDRIGLEGVRQAVRRQSQESGCSSAKALLIMAVRALSSLETADDWLLLPEWLDLSTENVWYDAPGKRVLFCLAEKDAVRKSDPESRCLMVFGFLMQLAALEAPEVYPYLKKLSERTDEEHMSYAGIKKELSRRLTGPG